MTAHDGTTALAALLAAAVDELLALQEAYLNATALAEQDGAITEGYRDQLNGALFALEDARDVVLAERAERLVIPGVRVVTDTSVPDGELWIKDEHGHTLGKIVNIGDEG